MAVDRNAQYGNIAVRNNWITREQFEEAMSLHSKLSARDANRGLKIEALLLERGLISDVQHQAVLSVMERMRADGAADGGQQRRKSTAGHKRNLAIVQCPHCGQDNPRGEEECGSCQGYIPPSGDDGGVELLESITCPACQRGITEDAQECQCGARFCPECRGLRSLTDPTCRHCGIVFPGMERVARARQAALASGAIKVEHRGGPVATHMPRWVVPLLIVVIGGIFAIAIPKGDPGIDVAAYNETAATLEVQVSDAYTAFRAKQWSDATRLYRRARATAKSLRDTATGDSQRERDASAELAAIDAQIKRIARLRSAKVTPTTGGDEPGSDIAPGSGSGSKGSGSGSTGSGSGSATTAPEFPVIPEQMNPEQRQAMLAELEEMGLPLPQPIAFDKDKLIIIFRRDGREVFGELLERDARRYTIRTSLGRRSVSTSDVRDAPIRGKHYHRGPLTTTLPRDNGAPLRGKPLGITSQGKLKFEMINGTTTIIRPDGIDPRAFYNAMRYAMNAETAEQHFDLAKLCLRLDLRDQAQREFEQVIRGPKLDVLLALPYLAPKTFLSYWLKRKSTADELLALTRWASVDNVRAADRARVFKLATSHPKLKMDVALQMAYVMALIDAGEYETAQQHLEMLGKSKNSELQFKARSALQDLEKTRVKREAKNLRERQTRVTDTLMAHFETLLDELISERLVRDATRRARIDKTFEALLTETAKTLGLKLEQARVGFRGRRVLYPKRPATKVDYGPTTWLVDPPAALYFSYGTDATDKMMQAHWEALGEGDRRRLLKGMFLERWFHASIKRSPIGTEKRERDVNDFRNAKELFSRLPPGERAGYLRSVTAR